MRMSTFSDILHSLDFRAHLIFALKCSPCKLVCVCMWLNFLKISMKEMTFKVAAPSQVFQCLFFKIALHLDNSENQNFFG